MGQELHRLQVRIPTPLHERFQAERARFSEAMGLELSEAQFVQIAIKFFLDNHTFNRSVTYPEKADDALGMVAEEKETYKSTAGAQPASTRGNHSLSQSRHRRRADAIGA